MNLKAILLGLIATSFAAPAFSFQCATNEVIREEIAKIKDFDENNVDHMTQVSSLAYKSGIAPGNFAWEWDFDGLLFEDAATTRGSTSNQQTLAMYPALNADITSAMGTMHIPANDYSGIFKVTYTQERACRRQIYVTGVEEQGEYMNFVGHVNVEVCSKGAANAFALGAQYYAKLGQKMENIDMFFTFLDDGGFDATIDALVEAGAMDAETGSDAKSQKYRFSILRPDGNPDVYYAKYPAGHPLEGHIAPRFSVKIRRLFFRDSYGCEMQMDFNDDHGAYAGLLNPERQTFSADYQSRAFERAANQEESGGGNFFLGFWNDEGLMEEAIGIVNEELK